MEIRQYLTAALATTALVACSSAPAAVNTTPLPTTSTSTAVAPTTRMTGTFTPMQSYSGTVSGGQRQNAYGTVELTVAPNNDQYTHVRLTVTVPPQRTDNLGWAIHTGGCSADSPPVMAPGLFPLLTLNNSVRASFDDDIPFALPSSGTYHVNVFRAGGTQQSDAITCAELRRRL
jgi:hypothetical protein